MSVATLHDVGRRWCPPPRGRLWACTVAVCREGNSSTTPPRGAEALWVVETTGQSAYIEPLLCGVELCDGVLRGMVVGSIVASLPGWAAEWGLLSNEIMRKGWIEW